MLKIGTLECSTSFNSAGGGAEVEKELSEKFWNGSKIVMAIVILKSGGTPFTL